MPTQTYTGTIEFLDLEGGVWVLKTSNEQYSLFRAPKDLLQEGLQVEITGQINTDVMTAAQVGPVLEVSDYSIRSSN